MGKIERRNSLALDDAYFYCRLLETGAERPTLFKVCNAIRTLDLALEGCAEGPLPVSICTEAWSRVRDSLFCTLVSSFSGYFMIYAEGGIQVEPGADWPQFGVIEFYPECSHRKNDSYTGRLERIDRWILNPLRWSFADGNQTISPQDFSRDPLDAETLEQEEAGRLLNRLYETCEEEASEGKKKAHRKWWQLYWEANGCPDRRQKHQLQKQMVVLQSIWGRPS